VRYVYCVSSETIIGTLCQVTRQAAGRSRAVEAKSSSARESDAVVCASSYVVMLFLFVISLLLTSRLVIITIFSIILDRGVKNVLLFRFCFS